MIRYQAYLILPASFALLASCKKEETGSADQPPPGREETAPQRPQVPQDNRRDEQKALREAADARRAEQQAMSFLATLRTQCDNTAWTLWWSNKYKDWRQRKSNLLSLNYNYTRFESTPPPPPNFPSTLRERWEEIVPAAVANEKLAAEAFEELAPYINARDYEDDGFAKGDALNAKLEEHGQKAHDFSKRILELYGDVSSWRIEQREAEPENAALAKRLKEDWNVARELAAELARGGDADRTKVEELSTKLTAIAEERAKELPESKPENADKVRKLYKEGFSEDLAVPLRRMLRETKGNPKEWAAKLEDRPRSEMMRLSLEIQVGLAGDVLNCLED